MVRSASADYLLIQYENQSRCVYSMLSRDVVDINAPGKSLRWLPMSAERMHAGLFPGIVLKNQAYTSLIYRYNSFIIKKSII